MWLLPLDLGGKDTGRLIRELLLQLAGYLLHMSSILSHSLGMGIVIAEIKARLLCAASLPFIIAQTHDSIDERFMVANVIAVMPFALRRDNGKVS